MLLESIPREDPEQWDEWNTTDLSAIVHLGRSSELAATMAKLKRDIYSTTDVQQAPRIRATIDHARDVQTNTIGYVSQSLE